MPDVRGGGHPNFGRNRPRNTRTFTKIGASWCRIRVRGSDPSTGCTGVRSNPSSGSIPLSAPVDADACAAGSHVPPWRATRQEVLQKADTRFQEHSRSALEALAAGGCVVGGSPARSMTHMGMLPAWRVQPSAAAGLGVERSWPASADSAAGRRGECRGVHWLPMKGLVQGVTGDCPLGVPTRGGLPQGRICVLTPRDGADTNVRVSELGPGPRSAVSGASVGATGAPCAR